MRNLKAILVSIAMVFATSGMAKKVQSAKTRYLHTFVAPAAHIAKTVVSIPAGLVGGVETTVRSKASDFRVFHGLGYGVVGTVQGAIATVLSPITFPLNLYRAITKKNVKKRGPSYILDAYCNGRESGNQQV